MSSTPLPVYLSSLGFNHEPFPLTPNEDGAFFTERLAEQFSELCHFIELRKGFMLVTGDVGVGKSTLTRVLLAHFEAQKVHSALVFNTFLQGLDLLRAIARDFGVQVQGDSFEACLQELNSWLLEQYNSGHNCVLILDDAQGLQVSTLELIRQLCNLESSHAKLLQIVMVAQPEIASTLERHDLRQLTSRIALHVKILPLNKRELGGYLYYRLQQAGNASALTVSPKGLRLLHKFSGGYIRRLNILADRCLFGLNSSESQHLDARLIKRAACELGYLAHSRPVRSRYTMFFKTAFTATVLIVVLPFTQLFSGAESLPAVSPTVPPAVSPTVSGSAEVRLDAAFGCHDQEVYPLDSARLAYFQTTLPTQTVEFGDEGPSIAVLQQALVEAGVLAANHVDGVMGPVTAAALARYQKREGLVASGHLDPLSVYRLECSAPPSGAQV